MGLKQIKRKLQSIEIDCWNVASKVENGEITQDDLGEFLGDTAIIIGNLKDALEKIIDEEV